MAIFTDTAAAKTPEQLAFEAFVEALDRDFIEYRRIFTDRFHEFWHNPRITPERMAELLGPRAAIVFALSSAALTSGSKASVTRGGSGSSTSKGWPPTPTDSWEPR